jgi:hypothetical protein
MRSHWPGPQGVRVARGEKPHSLATRKPAYVVGMDQKTRSAVLNPVNGIIRQMTSDNARSHQIFNPYASEKEGNAGRDNVPQGRIGISVLFLQFARLSNVTFCRKGNIRSRHCASTQTGRTRSLSLLIRARSSSVRIIETRHNLRKKTIHLRPPQAEKRVCS